MEKRNTISGIITAGIWAGVIVLFALVPVQRKPDIKSFREIVIQLEAASPIKPVEESKKNEMARTVENTTETAVEKNAVQKIEDTLTTAEMPAVQSPETVEKTTETVKSPVELQKTPELPLPKAVEIPETVPQPEVKPSEKPVPVLLPEPSKKVDPVPAPVPAPQKLQKSIEELMAEQQSIKTARTADSVDWDAMFGNSQTAVSSSVSETSRMVSGSSMLSGTAAVAAAGDTGATADSAKTVVPDVADASLGGKLAAMDKTWSGTVSGTDMTAEVSVSASKASGSGVSVVLEDGSSRKLLMPSSISPDISQYASLIEGQPEVTIRFEISPQGTVSLSSIWVSPGLPGQVVDVIRQYLSSELWFEQAATTGIATFKYKITRQ